MIVSENTEAPIMRFSRVLEKSASLLKSEAKRDAEKYFQSAGTKLESLVLEALNACAKGTEFDGSIRLASGQKFPDIVLEAGGMGVEVKSTTQNHWVTTGNSVLESTRVPDIKKVFLMFGKLADPIDFKVRPYEECLKEVLVTHYPRYQIDMNLKGGETIFDKIGKSYEEIRKLPEPVAPMIQYYSSKLRKGESLWWAGNANIQEQGSPITIRELSSINSIERTEIIAKSLVLFPEVFSNKSDKFQRVLMWLLRCGIVSKNLRDNYTAGGKWKFKVGKEFLVVPQIVERLYKMKDVFLRQLISIDEMELSDAWNVGKRKIDDRLSMWISLVKNETNDSNSIRSIRQIFSLSNSLEYVYSDISCEYIEAAE